jgi:hypothetical protein
VTERARLVAPRADIELRPGERVVLLAPATASPADKPQQDTSVSQH